MKNRRPRKAWLAASQLSAGSRIRLTRKYSPTARLDAQRTMAAFAAVTSIGGDTMLFTDHDLVIFAIASSAIALVLAVLLVSRPVEQRIGRLELKIRQAMYG
jgi:hypothetical protein